MKNFDPFIHQNCFYEYELKINLDEINQIIFLIKDNQNTHSKKTTYNQLNVLNFPVLKNLKYQIIDILEKNNLLLENSWAQLYNKNDKHGIHIHPFSSHSGIIYLSPDKPAPTIFHDKTFETKYVHQGVKNTLLLFPSYIPHEVRPLHKNEERLIISFNTVRMNKK
jgi:hypothetical protein